MILAYVHEMFAPEVDQLPMVDSGLLTWGSFSGQNWGYPRDLWLSGWWLVATSQKNEYAGEIGSHHPEDITVQVYQP